MQPFLSKIASTIIEKHPNQWDDVCLVFPSRRANVFFKQAFAKHLNKPAWAPQVFSIEEFIQHVTGLAFTDQTRLLFEFYSIYKSTPHFDASTGSAPEKLSDRTDTFDEFCVWAPLLLNDFNEADMYLANTDQLFSNLRDIKDIENWSFNSTNLSELQQQYLRFWNLLGAWHTALGKKLLAQKTAYPGLAYRKASELINTAKLPWKKIYFCGFNALTRSETHIIEQLSDAGKAEMLWDADAYYTQDEFQEAGTFIRKYAKDFKPFNWIENNFETQPKKVNIIGASKNMMQAKTAADIINTLMKNGESLTDTALVLNNEELLFPVLHAIPEQTGAMNITMGYPLAQSSQFGFIERFFDLHINRGTSRASVTAKLSFHYQAIIQLIDHPVMRQLMDNSKLYALKKKIISGNILFLDLKMISTELNADKTLTELVFKTDRSPTEFITAAIQLTELLNADEEQKNNADIDNEFVVQLQQVLAQVNELNKQYGFIENIKALWSTINRLAQLVTIPFYGEPLQGLQIMGMLETRLLDFKNVIMLSVNEGVLPKGRSAQSFIPFDLKKMYGLPTHTERDAVFAYHFYRLLQRAENIYILYNTNTDAFGSGEKSRFIEQLKHELPLKGKHITLTETVVTGSESKAEHHAPITIEKDEQTLKRLKELGEKPGFSPTSLSTYVKCKLQFYYRYVLRLKETEEVEETIGADVFGTIIHNTLFDLYQPYLNKTVSTDAIQDMTSRLEPALEKVFSKHYSGNLHGKNLLAYRVSLKFLKNFLVREKENVSKGSLQILALEESLTTELRLSPDINVKIAGKTDRIDSLNNQIRIIDYKTGNVAAKELKVESISDATLNPDLGKSLQLLTYGYLYHKSHPEKLPVSSGILSLKQPSAGLMGIKVNENLLLDEDVMKTTEEQLKLLLLDIFNPAVAFSQTHDEKICVYCPFNTICNR